MSVDQKAEYPKAFYCPISGQVMKNPHVDREGNSYELDAILKWLETKQISPLTRNPLSRGDLAPNRALKEMIQNAITPKTNPPLNSFSAPEVQVSVRAEFDPTANRALISVLPNDLKDNISTRNSVDLVCIIDVSGSMGTEVEMRTESVRESSGLSILDIVKHALRTIVAGLGPKDRIALVPFSSSAHVALGLTEMTDEGKLLACSTFNRMEPTDSTNIWEGLKTGLDLLNYKNRKITGNIPALFLLTDGQPNMEPPRGSIQMLTQYIDTEGLPGIINTFGFGYSLDLQILSGISNLGNGTFSFIPDAGFVGTIFIHAMANLLSTVGREMEVSIGPLPGKCVTSIYPILSQTQSWGVHCKMGNLHFGQSRDIVVGSNSSAFEVKVSFRVGTETSKREYYFRVKAKEASSKLNHEKERLSLVSAIQHNLSDPQRGLREIKEFVTRLHDSPLKEDVKGEILLAFEQIHFERWGKYFLHSISDAHKMQICNNFKDPGIQGYGGKLFQALRNQIDDIFNNLPPIKPSRSTTTGFRMMSMRSFNMSSNPCFSGDSVVICDDVPMKISQVQKGYWLNNGFGSKSQVSLILKTRLEKKGALLCTFPEGAKISPWHPVFHNNEWIFPQACYDPQWVSEEFLYSFVVKGPFASVQVNGIPAVTLGHGHKGDIREHPFLGTDRVLKALEQLPGFESGCVEISGVTRDQKTSQINGFIQ